MPKIYAPGTIGNVGPGFDVLGLCVEGVGDTISIELVDGESSVEGVEGRDAELIPLEPSQNATIIAAESFLREAGRTEGVRVRFQRELPVAGGLGSSAAASVAGAYGAAILCEMTDCDEKILRASLKGEGEAAGKHLDNIAPCYFGGLTAVVSTEDAKVIRYDCDPSLWVLLATPDTRLSTREARGVLPKDIAANTWTQQMANSIGVIKALQSGDLELLGYSMNDLYAEPFRKKMIPHFDLMCQGFRQGGANNFSISGAGPTVFSIVDSEESATRVLENLRSLNEFDRLNFHIGKIANQGVRVLL